MKYIILKTIEPSKLSFFVNQRIKEGFKPQGGLSISVDHNIEDGLYRTQYAQAMVKE
jgi:hypothetical protein